MQQTSPTPGAGRPAPGGSQSLAARLARFPVLEPEAEDQAAAAFQAGFAARAELPAADPERAQVLMKVIARADLAAEQLAGSMYRLLSVICHELAEHRYGRAEAAKHFEDLMSEALAMVLEAARTYDPGRGPAFHTWAAMRVRDHIRVEVMRSSTTMRSTSSWDRMRQLAVVEAAEMAFTLGRRPTLEELSAALLQRCLSWAESKLTAAQRELPEPQRREVMLAKLRKQGMLSALDNLDRVLALGKDPVRLDEATGDGYGPSRHDTVPDPDSETGLYRVPELAELRGALLDALSPLPAREREVLLYRYGFIDGQQWTYKRIARRFGLSSERIRQIEHQLLAALAADAELSGRLLAHLNGEGVGPGPGGATRYASRADLVERLTATPTHRRAPSGSAFDGSPPDTG